MSEVTLYTWVGPPRHLAGGPHHNGGVGLQGYLAAKKPPPPGTLQ